jgi:hypothetical protein
LVVLRKKLDAFDVHINRVGLQVLCIAHQAASRKKTKKKILHELVIDFLNVQLSLEKKSISLLAIAKLFKQLVI